MKPLLLLLLASSLSAQEATPPKLWYWSLATMAASNSLDLISSQRAQRLNLGHETNGWYTDAAGRFQLGKAVGVKAGMTFGAAGIEYLLIRKHPKLAKYCSILNFTIAAPTGIAAGRNFALRRPPQ